MICAGIIVTGFSAIAVWVVAKDTYQRPGSRFFVRAEEFHGIPEKIGISQYSFLSKLCFISQHRCIALLY